MIVLELTDPEALAFRLFREHQDTFVEMLRGGVFDVKNGVAVLNFDQAGVLTEIRKNVVTYKRPFSQRLSTVVLKTV